MGQLAVALQTAGYSVSGSDKEFYEPMGSFLANQSINLLRGYQTSNITPDLDLVVIGNALSYGHPEILEVERLGIPYTCFPRALYESIIAGKHSIVVCGTHGKTTTTTMITSILLSAGLDPSYFIGGVVPAFPTSLHNGKDNYAVIEGDEYDDAFFSKRPKFTHYAAETCIINAIEFDHADLYENLEAISKEFDQLVLGLPAKATVLACLDFPEVERLYEQWHGSAKCKLISYGEHPKADYRIIKLEQQELRQLITIQPPQGDLIHLELPVAGNYNARNACASLLACQNNKISLSSIQQGLKNFISAKRRQELRYKSNEVLIIEDFAHHPTAVKEVIAAVKAAFPDRRLTAVFEPRTNTSRRKVFEEAYLEAFATADAVILCEVTSLSIDQGHELLSVTELANRINSNGTPAMALPDAASIQHELVKNVGTHDVVLIMSNGSFGGLIDKLLKEARFS